MVGKTADYQFVVTPKIWAPLNNGDEIQEIADYLGYGDALRLYDQEVASCRLGFVISR